MVGLLKMMKLFLSLVAVSVLLAKALGNVETGNVICRPGDQFTCDSGQCIPFTWVCNGRVDCDDGSDEMDPNDCPACPVGAPWQCKNGRCIMEHYVCEGWNDCGDWSDEYDWDTGKCPKCPASFITCPETGRCIREVQLCNGNNDCGNWFDEREERCPCSSDKVRCPNPPGTVHPVAPRPCILPEYFCDEIVDCPDGSDEANCTASGN